MNKTVRTSVLVLGAVAGLVVAGVWWQGRTPAPQADSRPVDRAPFSLDNAQIADAGVVLANLYTGEGSDSRSLDEFKAAIAQRAPQALAAIEAQLKQLGQPSGRDAIAAAGLYFKRSSLEMYEGRFDDARASIEQAMTRGRAAGMPDSDEAAMTALLGIIALRRGEVENCIHCVGPSSCILPIAKEGVHTVPAGSREAIEHFNRYLEMVPGDLRVRWLLNLAHMTLGQYPQQVPPQFVVPLDTLESTADVGRFRNVAPLVGLTARGPNQAGGSLFDDFTGDGLPDLLVTSLDVDRGASLFVNRGDGQFEDRSDQAGLADQVYALNLARADIDNDGDLDVVLLRGGWETPMRLSLLRNEGQGSFADVTIEAGLDEPIATEAAAWGDYDNDGLVDLFVCGEYRSPFGDNPAEPDPRNRCRLYHNEGRGRFVDVAEAAGVAEEQCSKGCAWGDYDGDGRLDIFVSCYNTRCRLFHNEGSGKFRDVAQELDVTGPERGFACWFWDYDNDGRLDLYVNDYRTSLAEFVAVSLKAPIKRWSQPRLYRNLGDDGFEEVSSTVGLDRAMMPMGANFGDVDNDGYLDFYQGTGRMALEALVPNLMFKNDSGRRFDDVTISSGTGHLQKGHGISFADWDCDGDLDLFVTAGGGVPGDRAYNLLFENPGHGRHWLKVKLAGTRSNRAALGAQLQAVVEGADGTRRSIFRTIGNNGSFGGNSLVESLGLAEASVVAELIVTWPTSGTTQTFRNIPADQAIEITEGAEGFQPLPQPWKGGRAP